MSFSPDFTLDDIKALAARIRDDIVATPVLRCHRDSELFAAADGLASLTLKLELFQIGGSFKIRGALAVLASYGKEALARGVTAVSAGNHAIAVSYAAHRLRLSAKIVMPKTANAARVILCKRYGAEVILTENVAEAFETMQRIAETERRIVIHPFEGRETAIGTATIGLEILEQAPQTDVVIVPIGGGGLAGGIATAIKLAKPAVDIYGVEPFGADSMTRSFAAGSPQKMDKIQTIADSLAPPFSLPYSFALCRAALREIVRVSDDEMRSAMALIFRDAKLAVEPAGAAATAALRGPLKDRLKGKNVTLVICGANLDAQTYATHLAAAV